MLQQVIEVKELLDSAHVTGEAVVEFFSSMQLRQISTTTVADEGGSTDFLKIILPGSQGKAAGGAAPTMGIVGRLGGVGARDKKIGLVSDADGALAALACALKLAKMQRNGDTLEGDVIICTHICPDAPIVPHEPVPFMSSPVDMETMNRYEVDDQMDAVLSIDTTRGNRISNQLGFAVTPTIKEGYILPVAKGLLDLMEWTTGKSAAVLPICTQDITPYGNGLGHVNSILQPATATSKPVVGVALTAEVAVPGCATGATREVDVEAAARFCIEVAKGFTAGNCAFYDPGEFELLTQLYGSMQVLQTKGRQS